MHGLIRSVWHEPRPPGAPRRVWRDWVLVGVLIPVALLEGVVRPDLPSRVLSVVLAVGLTPTLLWRRTKPLPMVVIAFGASGLGQVLAGGVSPELNTMVYLLLLPYALFRWGSGREAVIGLAIILAKAASSVIFDYPGPADTAAAFAVVLTVTAVGAAFRYRARARTRELDQAKLLEREQLARDLHDTVAHHVSAMAIRAQAGLATAASRPDAATEALKVIEAEAALALAEMRAMVHVLRRNEPADMTPGRGLADLSQLESGGPSGPSVQVEVADDVAGLSPSVEAAIYRLAQESVTNARRHARHATRVQIRVIADGTSIQLDVDDDGDPVRPAGSPGYGITGMIERAELLGGTCVAGPNPDRGWRVTAVLPRAGVAT
ncbi:sensor histidine kinase [Acrocarpospora catenulata]|uniref:sensor histidine kinase n=1 Tax=Acrocarpospora catenulata TaxID=2836182 RepID=UPI0027E139F5|nr:histidine kinase [Acrocarpospora catenulata]